MHFKLILISLLVVSCNKELSSNIEFIPYVKVFLAEASSRGIASDTDGITMEFSDLPGLVVGRCTSSSLVQIDPWYWNDFDDETREIVIFHELGHCILEQDHNNVRHGIMNTGLMWGYTDKARSEYLDDFFYMR